MFTVSLCLPGFSIISFFSQQPRNWLCCSCWNLSGWTDSSTPLPFHYPLCLTLIQYRLSGFCFIHWNVCLFNAGISCMVSDAHLVSGWPSVPLLTQVLLPRLLPLFFFVLQGTLFRTSWAHFEPICIVSLFSQHIPFGSSASVTLC